MPYKDPDRRRAAAREATRRWYARNKTRLAPARREKDRARYAASKEAILSAKRVRYADDAGFAERIRATNREWYGRNRDARRDYNRRYWQTNAERLRARSRERNKRRYAKDPQ